MSFTFGSGVGAIVDGQYGGSLSSASMYGFADSSRETSAITVGPLRLILNAIGTSLTKIANAPFNLKALEITHSFMQPDALATRLTSHYQSEALRQAYVILGSVDVLGNPMIAWKNLKAGFQDFIYEPAYGISKVRTNTNQTKPNVLVDGRLILEQWLIHLFLCILHTESERVCIWNGERNPVARSRLCVYVPGFQLAHFDREFPWTLRGVSET